MTHRPTEAEIDQRVNAVYALLLRREPRQVIVQFAAEAWGVATRQADEYIARARDLMREEARRDREEARAEHLALRRDLFRRAYKAEAWYSAFQIAQDEAKLMGLYFTTEDHIAAVLNAGYLVYEPNTPEALAADQAIAAADDFECEVEIGLASPADGGVPG
jgi:hypothetical protein